MRKPLYNLVFNPDLGFMCQLAKTSRVDYYPVAAGPLKELKKQADVMNRQFERV